MASGLPSDSTPSLPSGRNPASLYGSIPDSMTTLELPQTDPAKMTWDQLTKQIQLNPDPSVRRALTTEAYNRVWNGPGQPEEMCPARLFDPSW
jgi:hypothetical protein